MKKRRPDGPPNLEVILRAMSKSGRFSKQIDLEPSEFGPIDRHQPFWGESAKYFALLFVVGFMVNTLASRLVYGEWPYFLRWLLV